MSHVGAIQGEPKIISTPGEYSLSGFTLHALGWHDDSRQERTLQRWEIEDMILLHVGALNHDMTDHELQELEKTSIDVLVVSIGGGMGLTSKQALALITKVEPKIVIPIHFALPGLTEKLEGIEHFAKEMGVDPKQAEKKLILKAKHIPEDELVTKILMP